MRDVTKTKPSHYQQPNKAKAAETPQGPSSYEGIQLTNEVQASSQISSAAKSKLALEILEHEASHGKCTQTFIKKIRKQLRAVGP